MFDIIKDWFNWNKEYYMYAGTYMLGDEPALYEPGALGCNRMIFVARSDARARQRGDMVYCGEPYRLYRLRNVFGFNDYKEVL